MRGGRGPRESREWIDTTVLAIRACRVEGDAKSERELSNRLLDMLMPLLRKLAGEFDKARGSLSREDLFQVAAMEAIKAVETYQRAKRGEQSFRTWVKWRARRAIMDQIRLHRADVCLPDRAQRGKGKWQRAVDLISRDAPEQGLSRSATRKHDERLAQEMDRLEDFLIAHERCVLVQRALAELEPQLAELLSRTYGIGMPREGTRALAARWCMSRRRVEELLAVAHDELREHLRERLR
ncbi:sigma-70 family RNA polymerase sigma factor [Myxococcus qinghaiensis]|uniref:sigma-70 family RNA polymerase sigma factor n=1 Tax=Myxococcus qinghaiensis TaxID=2906758 RepID=UPI0020A7B507|nr:sigma-70 family RNA polymerase sigma factor [Myxococcus qinghaiensis]MCP3163321.1 sigma-70 family RNA polymerase sigma factor [Myxococcus qinghaiensis]